MPTVSNETVARHLYSISSMTVNNHKRRAFYRSSKSVERMEVNVCELNFDELVSIPGVGASIANVIQEICVTGESSRLKALLERSNHQFDEEKFTLDQIQYLVSKSIYNEDQLKGAIKANKIFREDIPPILGYTHMKNVISDIDHVKSVLSSIVGDKSFEIAGSYRRRNGYLKDLDIVVSCHDVPELISRLDKAEGIERINNGTKRIRILINNKIEADLMICQPVTYASALLYATGSREHNIKLRAIAKKKGFTLSQHGMRNNETGEMKTFATEREIFAELGLKYLRPEDR